MEVMNGGGWCLVFVSFAVLSEVRKMKKYNMLLGWCAVFFVASTCLLYMVGNLPAAMSTILGWAGFWIVLVVGGGLMVRIEYHSYIRGCEG